MLPKSLRAAGPSLPHEAEVVLRDVPSFAFLALGLTSLPLAMLLGCVPLWLMAVAAGLAVLVWARPQEGASAGILFLFCASIVLPVAAVFSPAQTPPEMYYWAAGLLLITGTAIARLGLSVFRIPNSAKVFLAVSIGAAIYGLAQGIPVGYVLRQFYGILLLIAYLGIAIHSGSEALLIRRFQTFGLICAVLFLVYYIAVFAQYGLEKQANPAGPEASLLATVLLASGLANRNSSRMFAALILLLVPALLLSRSPLITALVAVALTFAIGAKSKMVRLLCYLGAIFVGLVGTLPPVADMVGEPVRLIFGPILPEGIFHADTLLGRAMQMASAIATVKAHPLLGAGLGGNIAWLEPGAGWMDAAFVDNGWAYLLAKMGIAGLITFLWFLSTVLRRISRQSLAISACLLAVTLVTMFSQASYFHFTQAPFMGTIAGLLLSKDYGNCTGAKGEMKAR